MDKIHYGLIPPEDHVPIGEQVLERSVVHRFEEIAGSFPGNLAVSDEKEAFTYAVLNARANDLAHAILRKAGRGKEPIPFLFGHDHRAILAFLAVLKTGRPYVALSTAYPPERMRSVLEDTGSTLLVTGQEFNPIISKFLQSGTGPQPLFLEEIPANSGLENPGLQITPSDLFSLVYTSGSTGEPKAVVYSHLNSMWTTLYQTNDLFWSPSDRISLFTSMSVAAGNPGMLGALLNGGAICLFDLKKHGPEKALEWIDNFPLTVYRSTPTMLRAILGAASASRILTHLRLMTLGGEPVRAEDIALFKLHTREDCILVNNFASAESGTMGHFPVNHHTDVKGAFLPAGYPAPGREIRIVDEKGENVQPGEVGEIIVRSRYMSEGYWKKPELNAKTFRPDPVDPDVKILYSGDMGRWLENGILETVGRRDSRVKIRGFSVQLEVVDACLEKIKGIREAACNPYASARGDKRLAAYLVAEGKEKPGISQIRLELASELPDYMIPSAFVWLDSLPRTITSKINRQALPPPTSKRPAVANPFLAPRTQQEEQIAAIWRDLLELDQVGVEDDFFELGGDSLTAISMTLEVQKLTGKQVARSFFQRPTIIHLLESLGKEDQSQIKDESLSGRKTRSDSRPLGIRRHKGYIHKKQFRWRAVFDRNIWADQLMRVIPGAISRSILSRSYPEGNQWLMDWCRRPASRQGLLRVKYDQFCQLIESTAGSTVDPQNDFPLFLFCNILRFLMRSSLWGQHSIDTGLIRTSKHLYWRSLWMILNEAPDSEVEAFFPVTGMDHVTNARQQGRGVILMSYHNSITRLSSYVSKCRLGLDALQTISTVDAEKRSPYWDEIRSHKINPAIVQGLHAGAAFQGQQQLARGEIVTMLSDQNQKPNPGTFHANVAGHRYRLKSGFADLALLTGATIIPQMTRVTREGKILTNFLLPFEIHGEDRQAQLDSLTRQYANFLTYCWQTAPETFFWGIVTKHLNLPLYEDR